MADDVRIEGLDNAKAAFVRLVADMPGASKTAIRAGAAVIGAAMEKRAPTLSGVMEGTIGRSVRMKDDGPLAVRVGPAHPLAPIFERGGEITPKRKERLAFEGSHGLIRPFQVTMPAKPFVRPAVDESRAAAMKAVERSAARQLRKRGRG